MADPESYSPKQAQEHVKDKALGPATTYPSVIGMLMVLAVVLNIVPMMGVLIGGVLGFGAGVVNGVVQYFFRYDTHMKQYIQQLSAETERVIEENKRILNENLEKYNCVQGVDQFKDAALKFQNFEQILIKQIDPNSYTFSRFYAAGIDTYEVILSNLRRVDILFQGLLAIDRQKIASSLDSLQTRSNLSSAEEINKKYFTKQLLSIDEQSDEIDSLLNTNVRFLSKLDELTLNVSKMNSQANLNEMDLEALIQDIDRLVENVKRSDY